MSEQEVLLKSLINLNTDQLNMLQKYYQILIRESQKYNLTTITEEMEVYIKHFYDSLLIGKTNLLNDNIKLADIGSGAGFPGIPLKIAYPNIYITLIEPTTKRANFLKMVIEELGLKDIEVINKRAEDYISEKREQFDLVTARAVAPLNILLELSIPFLKVNGTFVGMKGSNVINELSDASNAIKTLNVKVYQELHFDLPNELGNRTILLIKKEKTTSLIYPRLYTKIKKQTL